MPNPRMKHRRVVHRSTAGILKPIPEAVDPVGNPPPGLTTNTVAPLCRGTRSHTFERTMSWSGPGPHGGALGPPDYIGLDKAPVAADSEGGNLFLF